MEELLMVKHWDGAADANHTEKGGCGNSDIWQTIAASLSPMPKEFAQAPDAQIYNAGVPNHNKYFEPVGGAELTPETALSAFELADDARKSVAAIAAELAMLDAGMDITLGGITNQAWRRQSEAQDRIGLRISAMCPDELQPALAAANEILRDQSYKFATNQKGFVFLVEGNESIWGSLGKPGVPYGVRPWGRNA
jgi:hypothetical protein